MHVEIARNSWLRESGQWETGKRARYGNGRLSPKAEGARFLWPLPRRSGGAFVARGSWRLRESESVSEYCPVRCPVRCLVAHPQAGGWLLRFHWPAERSATHAQSARQRRGGSHCSGGGDGDRQPKHSFMCCSACSAYAGDAHH